MQKLYNILQRKNMQTNNKFLKIHAKKIIFQNQSMVRIESHSILRPMKSGKISKLISGVERIFNQTQIVMQIVSFSI